MRVPELEDVFRREEQEKFDPFDQLLCKDRGAVRPSQSINDACATEYPRDGTPARVNSGCRMDRDKPLERGHKGGCR